MNCPARCLAALILAAASSLGPVEAAAAEECVLPPEGSMMAALTATNLEYMASSYPACAARAPVDTAAMASAGRRTSGSALPARCVIPASVVPFLGGCVGHMCAQVWEDVILCDRGGHPLPRDPNEGLPCYGSRIGTRIGGTGNVNRLICMPRRLPHDPQKGGHGIWVTSAEGFPPSKNPAAHAITPQNLISCDGDANYGTAYAFSSREDICTRMGYSGGKIYAQCTAHPCPTTVGALWPNGKLRCLNSSDGTFVGTCLPDGRYCTHRGGHSFLGSHCREGGPDVVDGVLPPGGRPYTPPNYSLTGTRYPDGGSLVTSRRAPAAPPPTDTVPEEETAQTPGGASGPPGFAPAPAPPSGPKRSNAPPRATTPNTPPEAAVASPPAENADGPPAEQPPSDDPPSDE